MNVLSKQLGKTGIDAITAIGVMCYVVGCTSGMTMIAISYVDPFNPFCALCIYSISFVFIVYALRYIYRKTKMKLTWDGMEDKEEKE